MATISDICREYKQLILSNDIFSAKAIMTALTGSRDEGEDRRSKTINKWIEREDKEERDDESMT